MQIIDLTHVFSFKAYVLLWQIKQKSGQRMHLESSMSMNNVSIVIFAAKPLRISLRAMMTEATHLSISSLSLRMTKSFVSKP